MGQIQSFFREVGVRSVWMVTVVAGVLFAGLTGSAALAASKSMELGLTYGNLGANKSKGEPGTDVSFAAQSAVLFLFDQFAIGPALVYSRYIDLKSDDGYNTWDVAIGPRAKFYFTDLRGAFAPYGSAQLMTGQGKSKGYGDSEDETNSVAAGAGMVFFLGANAALDLELDYKVSFRKTEYDDDDDSGIVQDDDTDRDADTDLHVWFSVFL